MITYQNEKTYKIFGLSSDTKPILDEKSNGSIFQETDTGTEYIYNATKKSWTKIASSGGGGGGGSSADVTDGILSF